MQCNRQYIKGRAQLWVQENMAKPGWIEDQLLDTCVDEAADWYAGFDGMKLTFSANVVYGQLGYCFPNLYKITAAYIIDPSDEITPYALRHMTQEDMDTEAPSWNNTQNPQGTPDTFVCDDPLNFYLYPVPNYNLVNGLIVKGYAIPSDSLEVNLSSWPNPTDMCPLPGFCHLPVSKLAAYKRCIQFADSATYVARLAGLKSECDKEERFIKRKLHELTPRTRVGQAYQNSPIFGGWSY